MSCDDRSITDPSPWAAGLVSAGPPIGLLVATHVLRGPHDGPYESISAVPHEIDDEESSKEGLYDADCCQCIVVMVYIWQVLYTEMVTSMALVNAKKELMGFAADIETEHPVVLQLGGSSPMSMRDAAVLAKQYGYREININVGCPSSKVAGAGCFGAALMLEPSLVGEIASEIIAATGLPTTVKCRIGVNDADSYESLAHFIRTVHEMSGVHHFIVHARKAILNASFSPADNRKIPPLIYPVVYTLCKDFPHLQFTVNGGITDFNSIREHLANGVAGTMVGRAVVDDPFYWRRVDSELYGEKLEGM